MDQLQSVDQFLIACHTAMLSALWLILHHDIKPGQGDGQPFHLGLIIIMIINDILRIESASSV